MGFLTKIFFLNWDYINDQLIIAIQIKKENSRTIIEKENLRIVAFHGLDADSKY